MANEVLGSFIFNVLIEGSKACFTAQELRTERFSYAIPTPAALIGILEAVYWHPPIEYDIKKIAVCNTPKYHNIRKNEVKQKASASKLYQEMNGLGDAKIYTSECRTQRNTRYLSNVKYVVQVKATIRNIRCDRDIADGVDIFEKQKAIILERFKKQMYYRQPFLGLSEYNDAEVSWVPDFEQTAEKHISEEMKNSIFDYGIMRYKMNYHSTDTNVDDSYRSKVIDTLYFHPIVKGGIVNVDECVRKDGIACGKFQCN